MKKFTNSKKIIAVLLLICLAFTLAGCTKAAVDENGKYIVDEDSTCAKLVGAILEFLHTGLSYIHLYNYVFAIILLTIIVKAATTPLNIKQQKMMKDMQEINPKVQELNTKYANDPQKRQEEMAKIYQEAKVNPMSGCLPMLIQMPILFILFYGMRNWLPAQEAIDAGLYSFFWINDLSLTVANTPYQWILPIGCALVTVGQQIMSTANLNDTNQKMMLLMMPAMFLFITPQFPAALAVYWLFYGLITTLQSTWLNFRLKTGFFTPKEEKERRKQQAAEMKAKQLQKADKSRTANNAAHKTTHNQSQKNDAVHAENRERRANDDRDKPWH